ncbi:MAG: hypothetical protein WDN28_27235 [Chthoniobacter sp.]
MRLESSLRVLNEMEAAGVIAKYAIGGAVAAFLYIEPGTTFDVDAFIALEPGAAGLINLSPIYDYLRARGYQPQREGVLIEDWDVQFLPTGTPLEAEALEQAVAIEIGGVPTRIFTREHLMAICLQVGRPKDLTRLVAFVQEGHPDESQFREILRRHQLEAKWIQFRTRYLTAS